MALADDLKDYIARNNAPRTEIKEKHNLVIVGEWHAPIESTSTTDLIRTKATVRLLLELLADPKYRYFASEHFFGQGPIAQGVNDYLRKKALPPAYDKKQTSLDIMEVAKRQEVHRFRPVLDFIRLHSRHVLSVGSLVSADKKRDDALTQNFFGEFMARNLGAGEAGVLLVGARHAAGAPAETWPSMRMQLEKVGFDCVSIFVTTNKPPGKNHGADDAVIDRLKAGGTRWNPDDLIRLTSLVDKTLVTIATSRKWTNDRPSPFLSVSLPGSNASLGAQFEYVVLQKE